MIAIKNCSLFVQNKLVVRDLSLSVPAGFLLFLMGQNGSGKSSLAYALAGHPLYTISSGVFFFDDQEVTRWSCDQRARAGFFLSMQYPETIKGVTLRTLLKESFRACKGSFDKELFDAKVADALVQLQLNPSFLDRYVHDGLSGGEKKRCELLQLLVLEPHYIVLDEIDSGLDVDAVKIIGTALASYKKNHPEASFIIITHHAFLREYLIPDAIAVMDQGHLVALGDSSLLKAIEKEGYDQFKKRD